MSDPVDLLVVHGAVWSEGASRPADAVAIRGDAIVAVGRTAELESLAGPGTRRVDAGGAMVTPGITDAHLHLVAWARARAELALDPAATRASVLAAVAAFAAARPDDEVLIGRGWASDYWDRPPARADLDAVTGGRPALLHSKDFHAVWANSVALERAGVTRATADPPGGRFERDAAGEPTGVAREHAVRSFNRLSPRRGREADLELLRSAAAALHAAGITAVHDFEGDTEADLLKALVAGPGPRVRVLMHLPHSGLDEALASGLRSGAGDDWYRRGAVKLFADGTLGSRTAAMLAPYDGTTELGMELIPHDELIAEIGRAVRGGLSIAIHAIGDRAVRSSLDAFEAAGPSTIAALGLAPRIEHAQLVDPADRPRFAALGVAASIQPSHTVADIELAERFWSDRPGAYAWRSLLDGGARLAFGSDAPVEPPVAALGLHAAVTRARIDGTPRGGFRPAQRLDLDTALTAFTEGPARLAGSWPRVGRIAPGTAADLVVWDRNLATIEPRDLWQARPVLTLLGGDVVYED